jgi:glycosyltransferase involved in cell wall biosynthesis
MPEAKKKLLLIGSAKGAAHLRNFHSLVQAYFHEILVVSDDPIDFSSTRKVAFGLRNPFQLFRSIREVRRIIDDFQPNIIHVHQANVYALVAVLANKRRLPLVLTAWGSDVLLLPDSNFLNRLMVRFVLRKATFLTADAHFMGKKIESLSKRKDTLIANFGIDIPENDTSVGKEAIMYSNRLHEPLYHIDEIIRKVAPFLAKYSNWKLLIAGKGSETVMLQNLAHEQLHAHSYEFLGFLPPEENRKNYQRSQLFISIPESDGTAVSLLEAMALGCIPVVSDLPANREWINDEENGIIVQNENLGDALLRALTLDPVKVTDLNRQIIQLRASKESNRKNFFDLYDRCLRP